MPSQSKMVVGCLSYYQSYQEFLDAVIAECRGKGKLRAALYGKPQMGKSSLANALCSMIAQSPQLVSLARHGGNDQVTLRPKLLRLLHDFVGPQYRQRLSDEKIDVQLVDTVGDQLEMETEAFVSGKILAGEQYQGGSNAAGKMLTRPVLSFRQYATCVVVVINVSYLMEANPMNEESINEARVMIKKLSQQKTPECSDVPTEIWPLVVITQCDKLQDMTLCELLLRETGKLKGVMLAACEKLGVDLMSIIPVGYLDDSTVNWADDTDPRVVVLRHFMVQMVQCTCQPIIDVEVAMEERQ